jgi:nicotinamide mononucleotide (NMN) deamidase PncC
MPMLGKRGEKAGKLLQEKREKIFIVEATTGGLISSCLLSVSGRVRVRVRAFKGNQIRSSFSYQFSSC